jgi:hypothetical protein
MISNPHKSGRLAMFWLFLEGILEYDKKQKKLPCWTTSFALISKYLNDASYRLSTDGRALNGPNVLVCNGNRDVVVLPNVHRQIRICRHARANLHLSIRASGSALLCAPQQAVPDGHLHKSAQSYYMLRK